MRLQDDIAMLGTPVRFKYKARYCGRAIALAKERIAAIGAHRHSVHTSIKSLGVAGAARIHSSVAPPCQSDGCAAPRSLTKHDHIILKEHQNK